MNRISAYTLRACASLFVFSFSLFALAAEPIRIGAPLSLTGSLADEGGKEQQGLDMCIEAVNAKGGVRVGSETRPLEAVKYQILLMFLLAGASGLSAAVIAYASLRRLTDDRERLRLDRLQ